MNDDTKEKQSPDLARRLGRSRVGPRSDLEVHRHLFAGEPSYVIRNPLTLQCHRLSLKEYEILVNLIPDRTLADIFESLVEAGKLKNSDEDDFYQFIVSMHRSAFLNLPVSDDKILYRRYLAKQHARRKEKLYGFISLRIPLINPDAFLDKTFKWARPIFTRWFFLIWLALIFIGSLIVFQKRTEIWAPFLDLLTGRHLLLMWFILILLKAFHEFGHAYACKILGGHVPEMGIYLIAMTPCAYVDVTSSWGFTRKRHRIMVALAGVYVESIVALLALFVWALTEPSLLHNIAHQILLLATIVTVTMNVNPLMRFDGYYVLSDLLEIPNLRQRSRQYVLNVLKRWVLGVKQSAPNHSLPMKVFLMTFGIASSIYKVTIVLALCTVIALKAFLLGLLMAGAYVATELFRLFTRITQYLWRSPQTAPVRVRAVVVSIMLLIGLPVGIFLIPAPSNVIVSGQVKRENEELVRAQLPGFVREIPIRTDQFVKPGDLLAKLENHNTLEAFIDAQVELDKAKIQQQSISYNDNNLSKSSRQNKLINALDYQLQLCRSNLKRLRVCSETEGNIVTCLKENDMDRFVTPGDTIALIGSGKWVVQALLTDQQIVRSKPHVGQNVLFRCSAQPDAVIHGTITRIAPMGSRTINNPTLTQLGGGDISIDSASKQAQQPYFELTVLLDISGHHKIRYGMTGKICLDAKAQPIGKSLVQKFLRFTNSLRQG